MRKIIFLLPFLLSLFSFLNSQEPIIIDHNSRILSDIPVRWIDSAKTKLHIGYGHTSHGSQLATGMNALESFFSDGTFAWSNYDRTGELYMFEGDMWGNGGYLELDVGYIGWEGETREYLDANPECNVIIWAWCGEENTVVDRDIMTHYLQPMNQLEQEYPNVAFVYMTGPLNGLGPDGDVKQANDSIRNFCIDNNKILYDFADIEKYDPDMNVDYQQYWVDDECNYDPDGEKPYNLTENWAENWTGQNPNDTLTLIAEEAVSNDCSFGHTHCLNCVLKGIAAWQLWARIAGWEKAPDPPDDSTSSFTAEKGLWNDSGNWNNSVPDSSTFATIPENNFVTIDNNAWCRTLTVEPNATVVINQGDTLFTKDFSLETATNSTSAGKLINQGWLSSTNDQSIQNFAPINAFSSSSPPISNASSGMFNASEEELYRWDISSGDYQQISDNTSLLEVMRGYFYRNASNDTTVNFSGTINQGEQSYNLEVNSDNTPYNHWNMAGNPFPAPVDWDHADWDKTNVANSIYFHSENSGQPCAYVNGITIPDACFDGIIPSMSSFWVYADNNGPFSIGKNTQTTSRADDTSPAKQTIEKGIRLTISNNSENYESLIRFDNSASLSFDKEYDAFHLNIPKIGDTISPGFYSIESDSLNLTINTIPDNSKFRIYLGYSIPSSDNYTINAEEFINYNSPLYLIDKENNSFTDLTENNYTFFSQEGINNNRFALTSMEPYNLNEPIIIDHNSRILSDIPVSWIDSAKTKLHIGYGHTSHGSQLATGMDALESFFSDGTFDWSNYERTGELHMFEGDMWGNGGSLELDVGYIGWDDETREYLDAHPECNVIIWAWCGLENTILERDVLSHYLLPMDQLEQEYPNVAFVYMTGPLDGLGPEGNVKLANDSIRKFCIDNNKILYDFADIEKYDPDMNVDYQKYWVDDECDYDPDGEEPYNRTENWAENWINQNPNDTLTLLTGEAVSDDCSLGHTHCLNCVLKGIAAWQLWARIAGWEGPPEPTDDSTSSLDRKSVV